MTIINTVAGSSAKLAQKEVVPTSFPTVVEPPEGYDGLSKATVNAPENLSAENIKAGVDIAGVVGGYDPHPNLETVTFTPTVLPATVVADEGYDGLKQVNVEKPVNLEGVNIKDGVTIAGVRGTYTGPPRQYKSAFPESFPVQLYPDAGYVMDGVTVYKPVDLEPENIKKDVDIAGVVGTFEGGMRFDSDCSVISPEHITVDMFPSGLTSVRDEAFRGWAVKQIDIPNGVTSIGTSAFGLNNRLTTLELPETVKGDLQGVCTNCSFLTSVNIPSGVTRLLAYCFSWCMSLPAITLPAGLTLIHYNCFSNCRALTEITIPGQVDNIGDSAFKDCPKLANVFMLPATPPTLGTGVFSRTSASLVITVPKGTLETYKAATNWSAYADKMVEASE